VSHQKTSAIRVAFKWCTKYAWHGN